MNQAAAKRVALFLIPCLLALYVAPVLVVGCAALQGTLNGSTLVGKWFLALIVAPDSAFNLFHKVLIPITAAVTVATMWRDRNAYWTVAIVGALLLTIALSIWLHYLFGIDDFQKNMYQPANNPKVVSSEQFYTLATSFMGRYQETLATYLLVLLGVQTIKADGAKADDAKSGKDKKPKAGDQSGGE
jgi:hypothetical protein